MIPTGSEQFELVVNDLPGELPGAGPGVPFPTEKSVLWPPSNHLEPREVSEGGRKVNYQMKCQIPSLDTSGSSL